MKKTLFTVIVILAVMAMGCQNKGGKDNASKEIETHVRQRVEKMIHMHEYNDAEEILTADMYALQTKAQNVHFWYVFCPGFQWDLGTMDACSDNQEVKIEGVQLIDSLHCNVAMRYVDEGCYDEPYTLKLLQENGEWRIDDVTYNEGENTLREDCKLFYDDVANSYRTTSPEEIMEFLLSEEPAEESYTDPESIYCNNPPAIWHLIDEIKNCYLLFMQNPDYTPEYGKQIDAMLDRIASHL